MFLSDDPVADFERLDAYLNKKISLYPTCDYCGNTIQDEYCYVISEETVCCACLDKHFRQEVMPYE